MKHFALTLLLRGLPALAASCAERKPIPASKSKDVLFTLACISGGDAPIGWQVVLLNGGGVLVQQPGRTTASYVLTHKEFTRIIALVSAAEFIKTIEQSLLSGCLLCKVA